MSHFPLKAKIDKMVRWMAFMKTSYDEMFQSFDFFGET